MTAPTIPAALHAGDTIAFISPSTRLNEIVPARIERAKAFLERLGYQVKIIFNSSTPKNIQDSISIRCEEIHNAFRDPNIKAIMCTLGGGSANELLPFLDYNLIKDNPKIFIGYSDITMLHHAIFAQTNLQTFYGPGAISKFGEFPEPLPFTVKHFQYVLQESNGGIIGSLPRSSLWTQEWLDWWDRIDSTRSRELSPSPSWKWLRGGTATGRIVGGCNIVLVRLAGTPYFPDFRGKILFLENPPGEKPDDPFPLSRTRAAMADLRNAGVFDKIVGLVVGRPANYDEKMRDEHGRMILEACFRTKFPILVDVDIGHTDPVLTIPLNAMASLDSNRDEFAILEAAVQRV